MMNISKKLAENDEISALVQTVFLHSDSQNVDNENDK